MTDQAADLRFVRNDRVLFSEVGADVVALDVERGECFGFEDVAAVMWAMLAQPITADEICRHLTKAYDVSADQCREDVSAFLGELQRRDLVKLA